MTVPFPFKFLPLLLLAVILCGQPVKASVFNAESIVLDNGMQVVVIPNHRAPVVTHMVWYKVGAAHEPFGHSGLAHFFEHLMFKGTKMQEPGEFSRIVRRLGGQDNAFTSNDYTAYFQSIAVDHLPEMMRLEADRMRNLNPPADEFLSERNVIIEERRQRTENNPQNHFIEQLRYAAFPNHPYGRPVIGWMDEIKDLEWPELKVFYDQYYAPNNAILVVSGDITLDQLKPIAEQYYGPLEPREIPAFEFPIIPPFPGKTFYEMEHESLRQPSLVKIYRAPSFSVSATDYYALQVLEEIMAGGPTSRFYKNLVVDQKLAASADLSYDGQSLDVGSLWVSAIPRDKDVSLETLEAALIKEFDRLLDKGVTDRELEDAKTRLKDQAIFARDSLSGPAMIVGRALASGVPLEEIESWPEKIDAVTADQIIQAARKVLGKDRPDGTPVTGYLKPAPSKEQAEKG